MIGTMDNTSATGTKIGEASASGTRTDEASSPIASRTLKGDHNTSSVG